MALVQMKTMQNFHPMDENAGAATPVHRIELKKSPCMENATPCARSSVGKISEVYTNAAASIPMVQLKSKVRELLNNK